METTYLDRLGEAVRAFAVRLGSRVDAFGISVLGKQRIKCAESVVDQWNAANAVNRGQEGLSLSHCS